MDKLPRDHFVTSMQFTKHVYQDTYPAIDPSNPELSLAGKVVIITGASRGIGAKGIAPAFGKAGPKAIVLVATNAEKLASVAADINDINPAVKTLAVSTDISSTKSVADLFAKVNATFGHADVLINNAGVSSGGGKIHEEDPEKWWTNFEVNTKGAFLLAQQFIKSLPSPSTPATIINLVTAGAWQIFPIMSGYSVSKLAVLQLTTHLARAYPNITAVSLHPGLVDTDMMMDAFRNFDFETPELVGGLLVWLSGERAHFLSGKVLASQWSVEDLVERKEEIQNSKVLQMDLAGRFGKDQFE